MKLNFEWNNDGKYHQYCMHCHSETVERQYDIGKTYYYCTNCLKRSERSIVIDPAIEWWVSEDNEYWHESSGVFVSNSEGKFLFFERTIFPFALTIPSGHVDAKEEPFEAAVRELEEEVGIKSRKLQLIVTEDIIGDSCRRGSDVHRWHAYLLVLNHKINIKVKEEGKCPVWLSLDEALKKDLVFPVAYVINKFNHDLVTGTLS